MEDIALWRQLATFQIGSPTQHQLFLTRLCRTEGWSPEKTLRAYQEYIRFIYLLATTQIPLTPSESIDHVWHLHLIYTKSYWNDLCQNILGRPIHHHPASGEPHEANSFSSQYQTTLLTYQEVFHRQAPPEFWPTKT